jgi:hypothetical protein
MDPRSILREQIEELQGRVNRVNQAICAPEPGRPGIEPRLLDRVRLRFRQRLLDQDKTLDKARQMVLDPEFRLADCEDIFRQACKDCQPLFVEALAVLEGALARSARLDDGFCDAADRLIAEISKQAQRDWNRFTILNEGELFSNLAEMIRIRFPSAGVWDLPIAAHECGHFISTQAWERNRAGIFRHAFQDFLDANKDEPESPPLYHLHEYFADVFAAFAVGPAYALSALLLRFDASRPYEETDTHPNPAKRAYLILSTLKWMDRKSIFPHFGGIIDMLSKLWPPDQETRAHGDRYLDHWLGPMIERNFPLVRYETWTKAQVLAQRLGRGGDTKTESEYSLRDVLNAAWLARIWTPGSRAAIENAAAALCIVEPGSA